MATRRTHAFTKRARGSETDIYRKQRIQQLKSLTRSLTIEEIEELRKLLQQDNENSSS